MFIHFRLSYLRLRPCCPDWSWRTSWTSAEAAFQMAPDLSLREFVIAPPLSCRLCCSLHALFRTPLVINNTSNLSLSYYDLFASKKASKATERDQPSLVWALPHWHRHRDRVVRVGIRVSLCALLPYAPSLPCCVKFGSQCDRNRRSKIAQVCECLPKIRRDIFLDPKG